MAGTKNLISLATRSQQERKEIASKGQKASTEAKKRKATMRETLRLLLDEKDNKGRSYRDLVTLGLLKGAMKGNSNNYRVIVETLGELYDTEASKQQNGVLVELIEAMNNVKKS